MKKVWKMFSVLLFVGLLFTGCTPKENKSDETQEQSGSPIIDYEAVSYTHLRATRPEP